MEFVMSADALEAQIQRNIGAAKERLLEVASTGDTWTAFELKKRARNGWSAPTMGLALQQLLQEGRLEFDSGYRVRVKRATVG